MQGIEKTAGVIFLGCVIAACAATDGVEKRDAGTNAPAQMAEAASPSNGSPSTTEEGEISSRRVLPSDPCFASPDINCRNRLNQLREFKKELTNPTMTPVIPPVPTNGGRCVIDVSGQYGPPAGQPGARGTYRHVETQLWAISSTPIQNGLPAGQLKAYSVQWSTTGMGDRFDDNGVGTSDHWTWSIAGNRASSIPNVMTGEPQLTTLKSAAGTWLANMVPASFSGGIRETQQHAIVGLPVPPPTQAQKVAYAFGYPRFGQIAGYRIVESTNSMMQTILTINESQVFQVNANQYRNVPNIMPAYQNMMPRGTVDCTWNIQLRP